MFRELFKHIQYAHNGQLDFKIRCELGPLCGSIYSSFSGYKGHIYREHTDLLNEDLHVQQEHHDINTHNEETILSTIYDTQSDFDIQINDEEVEECETDVETDDEDIICWPFLNENIIQSSEKR